MNKEVNYTDEDMPIGDLVVVPDFLPPPDKLIFKVPREKITMEIHEPVLDFYRAEAERLGVPYSQLIRAVLAAYADKIRKSTEK